MAKYWIYPMNEKNIMTGSVKVLDTSDFTVEEVNLEVLKALIRKNRDKFINDLTIYNNHVKFAQNIGRRINLPDRGFIDFGGENQWMRIFYKGETNLIYLVGIGGRLFLCHNDNILYEYADNLFNPEFLMPKICLSIRGSKFVVKFMYKKGLFDVYLDVEIDINNGSLKLYRHRNNIEQSIEPLESIKNIVNYPLNECLGDDINFFNDLYSLVSFCFAHKLLSSSDIRTFIDNIKANYSGSDIDVDALYTWIKYFKGRVDCVTDSDMTFATKMLFLKKER